MGCRKVQLNDFLNLLFLSKKLFNLYHVNSEYLITESLTQNASIGTGSTIQNTPQSSSTIASSNPFEAAFALNRLRTASCSSAVAPIPSTCAENSLIHQKLSTDTLNTPQVFSSKIINDESLNTPQIFPNLQDVVSLPVTPAIQIPISASNIQHAKVKTIRCPFSLTA